MSRDCFWPKLVDVNIASSPSVPIWSQLNREKNTVHTRWLTPEAESSEIIWEAMQTGTFSQVTRQNWFLSETRIQGFSHLPFLCLSWDNPSVDVSPYQDPLSQPKVCGGDFQSWARAFFVVFGLAILRYWAGPPALALPAHLWILNFMLLPSRFAFLDSLFFSRTYFSASWFSRTYFRACTFEMMCLYV